jgi:SAM-dependent methyltransferase
VNQVDRKLTFNQDVKNYDKFRPSYPKELFKEIIDYSGLDCNKHSLEIGIGTGQATRPILETGCAVRAIEFGDKLAAYSKEKFSSYNNFKIKNISFEDFECDSNSIDLVYSATAFHWLPEEIAYPKVLDLLKRGGTMTLFWNRPFVGRDNDLLHQEIQAIYDKYRPSTKVLIEHDQERYNKRIDTIKKYGFVDLEFKLFHQTRSFNAEDYVCLLNTYSDHRILLPNIKAEFEAEIKSAINRHGGILKVYDTVDLYLARKPS